MENCMGARVSAAIPTFIHSLIELCVFKKKTKNFCSLTSAIVANS